MKKGFTLVELLAVIVIISLIAVIVVPTIGTVLSNSRKNADIASTKNYIRSVNDQISLNNMENTYTRFTDGLYILPLDSEYGLSIKGRQPESGWIKIENGKITDYCISYGDYSIKPDKNGEVVATKNTKTKNDSKEIPTEKKEEKPEYYYTDNLVTDYYEELDQDYYYDLEDKIDKFINHSENYAFFVKGLSYDGGRAIDEAELCFSGDTEVFRNYYCLKPDKGLYVDNAETVLSAFLGVNGKNYLNSVGKTITNTTSQYASTAYCEIAQDYIRCVDEPANSWTFDVTVYKNGKIESTYGDGQSWCIVTKKNVDCRM